MECQQSQADRNIFRKGRYPKTNTNKPRNAKKGKINMENKTNNANESSMETTEPKRKVTSKQVVAIIGIVLLVLMYLVTLLAAFFDSSASGRLFWMCLFSTIAIPLLIWIYTWMYGKLTGKHTLTDSDTAD